MPRDLWQAKDDHEVKVLGSAVPSADQDAFLSRPIAFLREESEENQPKRCQNQTKDINNIINPTISCLLFHAISKAWRASKTA